jgi:hypothetical protein
VGSRRERDVEAIVHEEQLAARAADRGERARQDEERGAAEVLLAQVNRDRPRLDAHERRGDPDGEIGREAAVRDEVDNGDAHL